MVGFLAPSTIGSVQFEGPQHVRNIFEIVANSENFVDHIFNTNDSMTTQIGFNKFVRSNGSPFAINFKEASLVNQFTNGFQIWYTPSDIGF